MTNTNDIAIAHPQFEWLEQCFVKEVKYRFPDAWCLYVAKHGDDLR